jgi:hypothetical protein
VTILVASGAVGCDLLPQNGKVTAGALVQAVAPVLTFSALATDGHVYYSASVEATSQSLQNVLNALGLPVTVTQDPNGITRIASSTPDGQRFTLVVQAIGSPGSTATRTNVVIEWDGTADSKKGMQILIELETKNGQKVQGAAKSVARP